MKKITFALAAILALSVTGVRAQDKIEGTIGADVVSRYYWRGQALGDAAIQPTLGLSWKGLSLTAWGSYGFVDKDDTKEFDLTLAYTTGGFNIGITDYWFSAGADPEGRYFKYNAHTTNHVFEANIGYDFGPLSLQWFTNFSGNDYKADGDRAFSSYVELNAPFKLGGLDWNATVGAVPFEDSGVYGGCSNFAVTNVSLKAAKELKITDSFSLPVFAQVIGNPHDQKAYLVCGFTLIP